MQTDEIDDLVEFSRLLGVDPTLVLHGGGNTSVKAPWVDITGKEIQALYVKGSGWDLATIERQGFTPLRLARLIELLELENLSDQQMVRELSAARLDTDFPQPSVESLLHAYLPYKSVLHSHADLLLTLTNSRDGVKHIQQAFGNSVVVVPYVMPGFDLARAVVHHWTDQSHDATIGMVLMNHGLFTFGETSQQAYDRHLQLTDCAQEYLLQIPQLKLKSNVNVNVNPSRAITLELAQLRRMISEIGGRPLIVSRHVDQQTLQFVNRHNLEDLATRGPLTPDHVIRTKRIPLVGRDVQRFAEEYKNYFDKYQSRARTEVTILDPAPRIVLDRELGMLAIGIQSKDAQIAFDIYHHTMSVISECEDRLGGWAPLEAHHLFDMEYWDLEQAKLKLSGQPPSLAGQIAVVTGAASGIGRACAALLLANGAAVVGLDISPDIEKTFSGPAWLGCHVDITDSDAQTAVFDLAVERFGGIDIAVLAAGIFGKSTPLAEIKKSEWAKVMSINTEAIVFGLQSLHPFLARSPAHGRVVIIGSKNVQAPGLGAVAYSASKAAIAQVARVAALEWATDGIRINTVHPDAVFDTGLWTEDLLAQRAKKYNLTVDQYKSRNLLGIEISSVLVANVVMQLISPTFAATTGAQIAVDGGSDRTL